MKDTLKHAIVIVLLLLGAQLQAQQVDFLFPYRFKSSNVGIALIDEHEEPQGDYVKLALITHIKRMDTGRRRLVDEMKAKSRALGADALMNFEIEIFQKEDRVGVDDFGAPVYGLFYYRKVTAFAIRYAKNITYPNNIVKSERYAKIDEQAQVHHEVIVNHDWSSDSLQVSFSTVKAKAAYDDFIHQYSDYHLFKTQRNVTSRYNEYKQVISRSYTKLQGLLTYQRIQFTYRFNGSVKYFKLTHIPDQSNRDGFTEKVNYVYDFSNHLPSERKIERTNKPDIHEKWVYNKEALLTNKYYTIGNSKNPNWSCELSYYSLEDWTNLLKACIVKI